MKRILTIAMLLGAVRLASAGTTNVYYENWGSNNSAVLLNGGINISTVGWTGAIAGGGNNAGGTTYAPGTNTSGPYFGAFANNSAVDAATGGPLPPNIVYFTDIASTNQTGAGMFYTTDTAGAGSAGTTTFVDITPGNYTNLSFSAEVNGSAAGATNYFAIMEGGQWYVSTTPLTGSVGLGGSQFSNNVVPYTNAASAWNTLTVNAENVVVGAPAGGPLSGPIQGFGIVTLPTGGGWNFDQIGITAFAPNPPPPIPATITATPINQTVYAGGGAQFLMSAAGTAPITYNWLTNGVTLANGSKYAGATTNMLTISNCNAGDAAATYSVGVTNIAPPGQTNSGFTLTVNPVPAGLLYAETYPYVGLTGNLGLNTVGWANAVGAAGSVIGIFQSGVGLGAVFDYSPAVGTNLNYTTDINDTGFSGLPFVDINPASFPAVTLQAQFAPGNVQGTTNGAITAYWAVQMTGGLWYSSAKSIALSTVQNNYLLAQLAFHTAATNWNTLTITAGVPSIGSQAGAPLAGSITGAGIVMIHNDTTGASMNWENFAITTNAATQLPPTINSAIGLYNQSVATGGGASFAVTTSSGALPLTYIWTLNGTVLTNGGRISGATGPTLTIGKATLADSDNISSPAGNVVAIVTNAEGSDRSDNYLTMSLFVTNAPIGQLYFEHFPYVGPSGNQPIGLDGWAEGVPGQPNVIFERTSLTGEGAAFAFQNGVSTTIYYATTGTDTNQAGLQFPNINPAFYPGMSFSVDIAPSFNAANMSAYIAVQFGANWYVSATALPVPGTTTSTYSTYTQVFAPAAAGWKHLSVTGAGAIVGAAASTDLSGVMTGAGVVFVNTGSGTFNFDNFAINATGLGGVNQGALSAGNIPLTWVGNPAVNLQSSPSLSPSSWADVPNTLGAYSISAVASAPQMYFRLVAH